MRHTDDKPKALDFNQKYFRDGNYKNYKGLANVWKRRVARKVKKTVGTSILRPRVLDVGCAQGYLIAEIKKLDCSVTGLEFSPYAIRNAEKEVAKDIVRGSILDAKFNQNKFDAVICLNVLEYVPERYVLIALKNLVRWTKQYVFFTTCFTHSIYSTQRHSPDNLRITVKTEKEWKKLFNAVGAKFKEVFYDGGGGDVLIFRKVKCLR